MSKHPFHVVVGDEFDFMEGRSRVVRIEHDPSRGALVTLVDVPQAGCVAARSVTMPIAVLGAIVAVYDDVLVMPVRHADGLEIAA